MWYLHDALGPEMVREFFSAAAYTFPNRPGVPTSVPLEDLKDLYEEMCKQVDVQSLSFDEIMALPELDERLEKAKAYTKRLAATPADLPSGHVFINGRYLEYSHSWAQSLQHELAQQVAYLQNLVCIAATPTDDRFALGPSQVLRLFQLCSMTSPRHQIGETSSLCLQWIASFSCTTPLTSLTRRLMFLQSSSSILVCTLVESSNLQPIPRQEHL